MDPTGYLKTLSFTEPEPMPLDPKSDVFGLSLNELLTREPYGIPRHRFPTGPELRDAYDAAQ